MVVVLRCIDSASPASLLLSSRISRQRLGSCVDDDDPSDHLCRKVTTPALISHTLLQPAATHIVSAGAEDCRAQRPGCGSASPIPSKSPIAARLILRTVFMNSSSRFGAPRWLRGQLCFFATLRDRVLTGQVMRHVARLPLEFYRRDTVGDGDLRRQRSRSSDHGSSEDGPRIAGVRHENRRDGRTARSSSRGR